MSEPLTIQLNGQPRTLPELSAPTDLASLVQHLGLKSDRIAIEHNGAIAPRSTWPTVQIQPNDRLEIVHFVGGGSL
jgi:thiamine biosynthesis protein ThiS